MAALSNHIEHGCCWEQTIIYKDHWRVSNMGIFFSFSRGISPPAHMNSIRWCLLYAFSKFWITLRRLLGLTTQILCLIQGLHLVGVGAWELMLNRACPHPISKANHSSPVYKLVEAQQELDRPLSSVLPTPGLSQHWPEEPSLVSSLLEALIAVLSPGAGVGHLFSVDSQPWVLRVANI